MAETKIDLPKTYRQWTLANYPKGHPKDDDIKLVEVPMPEISRPDFLVKMEFLTVDPYMRGTMNPMAYGIANPLGSVMRGAGVGTIVKSANAHFKVGDVVVGPFGWQEYAVSDGKDVEKIPSGWQRSHALGALGMPGATAYYGFLDVCKPKPGDTVFVSGAAGAVGSLVGQIAKIMGCNVIGSCSGGKVKFCKDIGFDHVINYKTDDGKDKSVETLVKEIKEIAPGGVNCYFDNTGGAVSDAVFLCLGQFSRVSVCGQISRYNLENPTVATGIPTLSMLLMKQSTAQGFIVNQFKPWTYGLTKMSQWIASDKVKVQEHVVEGFDNMRKAFFSLFEGANLGKAIIKLQ